MMDSPNPTFDREALAEANFETYANPLVAEAVEHAAAVQDGAVSFELPCRATCDACANE
jgi:hypothetical protein